MAALDHWLNVLDIALKHGARKDAEREAEREERRAAQARAERAERAPRIASRSFGGGVAAPADPSCCLAKRRFSK